MNPVEVLSFGEALVDFLPQRTGAKLREVAQFKRCVGGAPANLALGIARLGGDSALMCKLGADEFGYYLREALGGEGVDVTGVVHTPQTRTGITFVEIDEDGERSFLFYRHPSADMTIEPSDVNLEVIRQSRIVHSGTNLMTRDASRAANILALQEAKKAKRLVSLDANIRLHQWPDPQKLHEEILGLLNYVDLFKANDEEVEMLCGTTQGREAFDKTLKPLGIKALVHTHGGDGATLFTADREIFVPAPRVKVVDTTGAGDAFLAGLLRGLTLILKDMDARDGEWPEALDALSTHAWTSALKLANFTGSRVCAEFGATCGMPLHNDVPWSEFQLPQ